MIGTLDRPPATARLADLAARSPARAIELVGAAILRYGLVLFLVGIGLLKFTEPEAQTIQPLVAHSPLLAWVYTLTSVQGGSIAIGIVEITLGLLIASRRWQPRLSAIGSLGASLQFLITLSFLFTTPGLSADTQGFLMKDLMLFGAALWTAGDALRAAQLDGHVQR